MKLFLMRHAEAEKAKNKEDFQRELTAKGKEQAATAAEFLSNYNINKILVSSAKRTQNTAEIIQQRIKCKYEILSELYDSNSETIIKLILNQDNTDKNLLVIAHNPGIFGVALEFVDSRSSEYDELLNAGMPPGKIITLDLPKVESWKMLLKKSKT